MKHLPSYPLNFREGGARLGCASGLVAAGLCLALSDCPDSTTPNPSSEEEGGE